MNFKISSKQYHYRTGQGIRDEKAARWTRQFKSFEEADRNGYDQMPSPKGANWRDYIEHRMRIMKKAIAVYTTEKYSRLRFDKYIESNRTSDKIAAQLVCIILVLHFYFYFDDIFLKACIISFEIDKFTTSHRVFG